MNHTRIGLVALALAFGVGALAGPAAGQAANDKERICGQLQNRTPPVGSWASYKWTGGRSNGGTMRMAVVGQETQDGKTYYWYEVTIADPSRANDKMILQMLVAGLGTGNVRSIVMKSGQQPAMKMPAQMIQMVNSSPGMNMAADLARQCQAMEVVGWEQVTVPGGQFRALHLRGTASATVSEVWVQPDLPFAVVKSVLNDGGAMELGSQGTGAKSSITETPVAMPGLPGATPPN